MNMFLASKKQEVAWKLQKPNNGRKTETYVFRSLSVKEPLMNLQKYQKKALSLFFLFMLTFHSKMMCNNQQNVWDLL